VASKDLTGKSAYVSKQSIGDNCECPADRDGAERQQFPLLTRVYSVWVRTRLSLHRNQPACVHGTRTQKLGQATNGTKCTFEEKDEGLSRKVVLGSLLRTLSRGSKAAVSRIRVGHSHRRGTCVHPSAQTFSKLSKIVNY
jgi:hypothetical protein